MVEYMGTKDVSEKWDYNQQTISRWCREGLIEGAEQDAPGSPWRILVNEKCPENKY